MADHFPKIVRYRPKIRIIRIKLVPILTYGQICKIGNEKCNSLGRLSVLGSVSPKQKGNYSNLFTRTAKSANLLLSENEIKSFYKNFKFGF